MNTHEINNYADIFIEKYMSFIDKYSNWLFLIFVFLLGFIIGEYCGEIVCASGQTLW